MTIRRTFKNPEEHSKNISKSLIGNTRTLGCKHSSITKKKISDASKLRINELGANWKGDDVGYGIHKWVYKTLGQPDTCWNCGKSDLFGRQIHWSNVDHKYKRNIGDWQRLCAKCHKKYDKEKGYI